MEFNETSAQATLRKVATKSQAILDGNHDYTPAQVAEVIEKLNADAKAASDYLSTVRKARELSAMGGAAPQASTETKSAPVRSIGEALIRSDAYAQAKSRVGSASSFHASFETKANIVESPLVGDVMTGNGGAVITPNFLPGIVDIRQQPLVVADLFSQGTTDSPIIVYVRESARTNAAAEVAEGGLKPQSDTTLERVNEPVVKIPHYVTVSDEMMEDSAQLMAFLNSQLVQGIRLREQNQLINGNGTSPNLSGILDRTGLQTPVEVVGAAGAPTATTAGAWLDAIHTQISNIRWNAFCEPDAILVNPADWNAFRLGKDSNGQYFSGGPFTGAYGNGLPTNVDALWGFRVVVTPVIASGTVLVGAFREAAQIFRRSGIRVEMTNSDGTDFVQNLVKIRAEERLGLAVYRPGCFGTVVNVAV